MATPYEDNFGRGELLVQFVRPLFAEELYPTYHVCIPSDYPYGGACMIVEALESHEQPIVEVSVIKYDDQCHFPQSVVRRSQRIRTAPCWRKKCFGCNEEKRSRKAGPRAEASRNVCEHGSPMKRGRPY